MAKVLLIEDDEAMATSIKEFLQMELYNVELVTDGAVALSYLEQFDYDAAIMDWGLPGMTGVQVCRNFRSRGGSTPILMLTGRKELDEKETGFEAGADDYLTKPFQLRELAMRLKALMRRSSGLTPSAVTCGALKLDTKARRLTRDGDEIDLAPLEYLLLEFFMKNQDQVFSPEAILNRVWPADSEATGESLRTYIRKLRRKIDKDDPISYIKNQAGVGYRFNAPRQ